MWCFLSAAFLELLGCGRLLCSLAWRLQLCWPEGQCESLLALVWGPGIPFQHMDFKDRFPSLAVGQSWFSLAGSSGGQSSACPRSAWLSTVLKAGAWPCMAPHSVPCLSPGQQPGRCTGLWEGHCPSLPPSCFSVALWPGSEMQRGRCYRARGGDVPLLPHQCKLEAPCVGRAESRPSSVSAVG